MDTNGDGVIDQEEYKAAFGDGVQLGLVLGLGLGVGSGIGSG